MSLTLKQIYDRCEEVGECQIWLQAAVKGHPQAYINGKGGQLVRRYIFSEILGKPLLKGHVISVKCRQPRCVASDCLIQVSHGERLRQVYAEGGRNDAAGYLARVARYVRDGQATLSFAKAREIRARTETNEALAAEYGVHPKTISNIRSGITWRETLPAASIFSGALA